MQSSDSNNQISSFSSSPSCLKFSLGDVKRATNDFAKKNFVAKVHFGSIYRGKITGRNGSTRDVAVKRFDKKSPDSTLVLQKEINILTSIHHVNIISLVGFCDEEDEKILVYEFMPNSSIYGYLFTRRGLAPRLTVEQRLEICLGVAKGLDYLHSGSDLNIIHGELNTNNVLLDASLVPKITGFEFSKTRAASGTFSSQQISKNTQELTSLFINPFWYLDQIVILTGKEEYLAPECYEPNYKPSQKTDVYAFGLLLLEVLCEMQSRNRLLVLGLPFVMRGELPKFTPKHVEEEISQECARECVKLIRDCLEFQPDKRLDMNQVVSELELALKLQKQIQDPKEQIIKLKANLDQSAGVNNRCHSFSLNEIKRATNEFSNTLGEGGFGKVYLGKVSRNGTNVDVAVKRMSINPELGDRSFQQEKKLLSACNHANIISLVGFCDEQDEKILVYEFMPNGSLYDHIYNHQNGTPCLTVEQRLEICLGVAEGLSYLHSGKDYNIIHSDLKTENILLDANLVPKISDFGLSRTRVAGSSTSAQVTKHIQGTEGYIAPECYEPNYKPSRKADVYAFGVILLEVLCEKPGWERLVIWALLFVSKGKLPEFVPEHVKKNISPECSRACANLINDCLEIDPNNRPSITHVIANLELALTLQKINPHANSQKNKSQANSQQRFSLSGIKTATNKFSRQNLLGETKFEKVYRGNISVDVAVKRKKRKVDQDSHLFQNEIDLLSACHHANIISLVGYCDEPNENVLVYEFMPNGSLYDHLHSKRHHSISLTVEQRLDICLGVAKGLSYLHSSTQSNNIRSYLNSDSILLDVNLVPKISNFEFPRNCADGMSTSQQFKKYKQGMKGYLAPECNEFNYNVSKKTDVYAFGVIFLEVLCERPPRDGLVRSALPLIMEGDLQRLIPEHVKTYISQECLRACENLIKDCLEIDPDKRPFINQVVDKLELASKLHMQEANYYKSNLNQK